MIVITYDQYLKRAIAIILLSAIIGAFVYKLYIDTYGFKTIGKINIKQKKITIDNIKFILTEDINKYCDKAINSNKNIIDGCVFENYGIVFINSNLPLNEIYRTCVHEICHIFVEENNIKKFIKKKDAANIEEQFCKDIDDYSRFYICNELIEKLKQEAKIGA